MQKAAFFLLIFSIGLANNIQVVDVKTGSPLPGVNITVVGTMEGMNTDLDGYFVLDDRFHSNDIKFSYIGYLDTTLAFQDVLTSQIIQLQPDVLTFKEVEVVSSKLEWEQSDLPSIVTVLRTRDLVNQGSVELKEALQRDPAVVIDESITGKHEISIRGSNANEVLIIYDGIPLNSSYAGGFDLSWLNLNDIETISIIKGGGTLRYGSGAFGGVIVLTPIQKGASGISLNFQNTDRHLKSYSVSDILQVGSLRTRLTYSAQEHLPFGYYNDDVVSKREFLNFYSTYALRDTGNYFSFNFMGIDEAVDPTPQYATNNTDTYSQLKYSGDISILKNMEVQVLRRETGNDLTNLIDPKIEFTNRTNEQTDLMAIENKLVLKKVVNFFRVELKKDAYTGLSRTKNISWDHIDLHDITLSQDWYAFTNVFKYRTEIEVPFVDIIELNSSYRYDNIYLDKSHVATRDDDIYIDELVANHYDQISRRSGFTMTKRNNNLRYQVFYAAGTNLRYPSMNDLYLRDHTVIVQYQDTPLTPELNSSSELGLQASIQPKNQLSILETVDLQASIYKNRYTDKIYYKQMPKALPTPLNMSSTQLEGFELSIMSSLFRDKLRLFMGTSRLTISSYTIFPNKPKFKDVVEVDLNNYWGSLRLQYFHEGKQFFGGTMDNINWIVTELDGRENLNIYSSLKLNLSGKEYIVGATLLNLLSDENEMHFLKQRKWSLNVGVTL